MPTSPSASPTETPTTAPTPAIPSQAPTNTPTSKTPTISPTITIVPNHCLNLNTAGQQYDDGFLNVQVNGEVVIDSYFGQPPSGGSFHRCFERVDSIVVHGPDDNGWAGNMFLTIDGVFEPLTCVDNCSGHSPNSFDGYLAVDGNHDV
eukprot:TRINITY_DN3955_c0_g1_i1.p1 TRINITY_DN3955_c0_g1~~TRINITY_DN3955_c0_g1_i1.p1  ORF type:complete len:148 (-),score=24.79 TRINITY_DN3955_c0_g1_i1:36-479(-)